MSARTLPRKNAARSRSKAAAKKAPLPYQKLAVFGAASVAPRVVVAQPADDDDTSCDAAEPPQGVRAPDGSWGTLLCEKTGE